MNIDKRYLKKTLPQLHKIAQRHFNKYIRERDKDKGCISCGREVKHAGHFYSIGSCIKMRYDEMNVHGQCVKCNMHEHGNLLDYRKGLINRYGEQYVKDLENKRDYWRRNMQKYDKITLIEIINNYK